MLLVLARPFVHPRPCRARGESEQPLRRELAPVTRRSRPTAGKYAFGVPTGRKKKDAVDSARFADRAGAPFTHGCEEHRDEEDHASPPRAFHGFAAARLCDDKVRERERKLVLQVVFVHEAGEISNATLRPSFTPAFLDRYRCLRARSQPKDGAPASRIIHEKQSHCEIRCTRIASVF